MGVSTPLAKQSSKTEAAGLDELVPDPKNRRVHNPRNLGMIADALRAVGAARSIVIDEHNTILAGNGVTEAAREAGITRVRIIDAAGDELIAVRRSDLSDLQKRDLALFDNRTGELATWNTEQLREDREAGLSLRPFWTPEELAKLLASKTGRSDPNEIPAERATSIVLGDVFELGEHRLLCGDTVDPAAVARVVGGRSLTMLHADPPYGMGKEADGIANDNLYDDKLDAFQVRWWRAWRPALADNGSAYIWGNAPDLWRLWWRGGLGDDGDLIVRNEIVWDKGSAFGMSSEGGHSFPPASERCLFLMLGQQFLGNQNIEDYFEGYEPLRSWLAAERDRAGFTNADVNKLTRTNMAGHWFTKSQFAPISKKHYETLAEAAAGRAFVEPYDELFNRIFGDVRGDGNAHRRELSERLRESRTYFDNTHDTMTDVWRFPRVHGDERFGHATPKPVAMVARALLSSSRSEDVIGVPFGGTGPEVIAAEQWSRRCAIVEIEPIYCQVIVDRWEAFTGRKAAKVGEAIRA
jgi:DNA modification methylase